MHTFSKAQLASLIATLVDNATTWLLVQGLGLTGWWVLAGGATGTLAGGITSFLIARHWVFRSGDVSITSQAWKYLLVWAGSFLLNVGGLALLNNIAGIDYRVAKIGVSIMVGIFYNYGLQKRFVFK